MKNIKLDEMDVKLLTILQENGRITNLELAKRVGISPPSCLRRVRILEEQKIIRGYHADVDHVAVGFHAPAIVQVFLSGHKDEVVQQFLSDVEGWPEVRECYMVTGEADYVLKIVAQDWDSYRQFLIGKLLKTPNVHKVHSSIIMRKFYDRGGVPMEFLEERVKNENAPDGA
ncbi:MAG TPA: ArsR family transcriptional regulator [Rhodospirillaceae bacterium]|nr:MAG: hypothetical protein A2018_06280 [Alphaproteobacteria bacterium GWF2_58_20]HAU29120.1 ArsR family transcriptional regulator [Rhodospirillaceae bacterium]